MTLTLTSPFRMATHDGGMADLAGVVLEQLQNAESRPLRLRKTIYRRMYSGPSATYTQDCWEAKESCDVSIESTPARYVLSGDKVGALHVGMESVSTILELLDMVRETCWLQGNGLASSRNLAKVQFSIMCPGRENKSLVVFAHLFSRPVGECCDDDMKAELNAWLTTLMPTAHAGSTASKAKALCCN